MPVVIHEYPVFLVSKQTTQGTRTIIEHFPNKLYLSPDVNAYYQVCVQAASIPYTIINVSDSLYTNSKYSIDIDTGASSDPPTAGYLEIPEGAYYSIQDIQDKLEDYMDTKSLRVWNATTNTYDYPINLSLDESTARVTIDMDINKAPPGTSDIHFYLGETGTTSGLGKLLGISNDTVLSVTDGGTETLSQIATSTPTIASLIENGIDIIIEGVGIKTYASSFKNTIRDEIDSHSTIALRVMLNNGLIRGGQIHYPHSGERVIWIPFTSSQVSDILIRFRSPNTGEDLHFLQGSVGITLIIRTIKIV